MIKFNKRFLFIIFLFLIFFSSISMVSSQDNNETDLLNESDNLIDDLAVNDSSVLSKSFTINGGNFDDI